MTQPITANRVIKCACEPLANRPLQLSMSQDHRVGSVEDALTDPSVHSCPTIDTQWSRSWRGMTPSGRGLAAPPPNVSHPLPRQHNLSQQAARAAT